MLNILIVLYVFVSKNDLAYIHRMSLGFRRLVVVPLGLHVGRHGVCRRVHHIHPALRGGDLKQGEHPEPDVVEALAEALQPTGALFQAERRISDEALAELGAPALRLALEEAGLALGTALQARATCIHAEMGRRLAGRFASRLRICINLSPASKAKRAMLKVSESA